MTMNRTPRFALMAAAALVGAVLAYFLMQRAFGPPDTTTVRSNAAASGREACFRTARAQAPASVTDARVTEYCACATDRSLAALDDDDLAALDRGKGVIPPAIQAKLTNAATACQSSLLP